MAKIGDLFVRLGLKSDDFKKGIQQAKTDTSTFAGKLKSMSGMAKAAWAAVGAAVVKFAHDAVKMTQTWGDQWAIEMEGIKGAYGAFVRQISSGEGWSNLLANMVEARRVAKEVASSLDEVFERRISLSYEEAQTNKAISELQLVMRDASKSDAERMDAAKQIIALEKQLGETKRSVAQQEADAQKQLFMSQTGLNAKETEYLLKNYNLNRDSINQARAYLAERTRLEGQLAKAQSAGGFQQGSLFGSVQAGQSAQDAKDALKKLDEQTSTTIKHLADLTKKYDKSNDDLVSNMANTEIAVINVDTEINRASTRATAMLGSLTEAASKSSASDTSKATDEADKILQRAQDAAKTEVQLLDEKYAKEKALLESFGKDTEALTAEYISNLLLLTSEGIDDEIAKLANIEPVKVKPIELDDSGLEDWVKSYEEQMRLAESVTQSFNSAVVGGLSNGCQELMNQLMGVSEFNTGALLKALLEPLADMAVRTGEIIMAEGIAVEAAKTALKTFGGVGAIVAGAALIAVGAAAKAGLAALASSGSSSSSATYASGSGSSSSSRDYTTQNELTVYVKGTIKGSDIVLSGNNTLAQWDR